MYFRREQLVQHLVLLGLYALNTGNAKTFQFSMHVRCCDTGHKAGLMPAGSSRPCARVHAPARGRTLGHHLYSNSPVWSRHSLAVLAGPCAPSRAQPQSLGRWVWRGRAYLYRTGRLGGGSSRRRSLYVVVGATRCRGRTREYM
eukprot:COSAG02_NODE_2194_length_9554_cov_12.883659_10_plen_144_part_00